MVNVKEHVEKGYIFTRIVLEVMGKPKEHIEQALKGYIEKISKSDDFIMIEQQISETKQIKDSELFNIFAEMEILVKGFSKLADFCFNYMPASIEILEPSRIMVDANSMTNLFNDFQEKLHKADFLTKTTTQQNQIIMKNLNGMIRNALIILLKDGGKSLNEISKLIGLKPEDTIKYLEKMIEDKKMKKIGEKYFLEF